MRDHGSEFRLRVRRQTRRSTRLANYDYSQPGAYFVTVVASDRLGLFGEVMDGKMILNERGRIVEACWLALPDHFPNVELGVYVVMPNHLHGIVVLANSEDGGQSPRPGVATVGATPMAGGETPPAPMGGETPPLHKSTVRSPNSDSLAVPDLQCQTARARSPCPGSAIPGMDGLVGLETPPLHRPTLGQVIVYFKYQSTKQINLRESGGLVLKYWQRNYYDHIIRNGIDLDRVWNYIRANPARWTEDEKDT